MSLIRPETPSDTVPIRRIHLAAFPTSDEANLVECLRDAQALFVSLLWEHDGQSVAHVAFSLVTVDGRQVNGVGLGPVAVDPGCQRRGIGSTLIRAGFKACHEAGCEFVVVLGEPAFYRRFGFATASRFGLHNEYGVDEPFMVLELRPGALNGLRGLVRYHAAFAELP
jgi:putative acetyltransferase